MKNNLHDSTKLLSQSIFIDAFENKFLQNVINQPNNREIIELEVMDIAKYSRMRKGDGRLEKIISHKRIGPSFCYQEFSVQMNVSAQMK